MDVAAASITDVRVLSSSSDGATFLHLAHPNPVHINTIMRPVASLLGVPVVPYKDWLGKIEQALRDSVQADSSDSVVRENPVFKLIEFYRAAADMKDPTAEAFIGAKVSVKQTVRVCQTLGSEKLECLSAKDVELWLGYWQKKGVIQMSL